MVRKKNQPIKICTTYRLPNDTKSFKLATDLNPDNVPMNHITKATDSFTLAAVRGRLWKAGQELTVKFIYPFPSETLSTKIIDAFKQWEKYANIKFRHLPNSTTEPATIRIAVTNSGSSWSYVGTDMAGIAQNQHNMEFGWLDDNSPITEINRVVIHEFGHALGCIHEHQNPSTNVPWDKNAVYAYYSKQGWDKRTVDINLFQTYEKSSTNYSQFDKNSIMLYSIPNSLTIGDYEVGWNNKLSDMDKTHIGVIYPFEQKPIPDLGSTLVMDTEITTSISNAGEIDKYTFRLPNKARVLIETKGDTDVIMSLIDSNNNVLAHDDDSGEGRNAKIVYDIRSDVLYTVKIKHYSVKGTGEYRIKMSEFK